MKNRYIFTLLILIFLFIHMLIPGIKSTQSVIPLSDQSVDLVIIIPQEFVSEIPSLINHKEAMGIKTDCRIVESIYDAYEGNDSAEQIKYFIKDELENHQAKYVLLIGDIKRIPMRTTSVSWTHFGSRVVEDIITDFYYEDIYDACDKFSHWDTNHDGNYSEVHMVTTDIEDNDTFYYIDEIDLISDISVGRLPCKTSQEVRTVINKIITYEQETFGSEWFTNLILIGGDTFPLIGDINEGEFVTDHIQKQMNGFNPIKLWTSTNTFSPLKINHAINSGAGFVCYSGHGFRNGFGTHKPNDESIIKYYTPYSLGLFNGRKYPIMYFDACWTAALDNQILHTNFPCLAWSMVKKPFGGAVASIGSTRIGYGGFINDPLGAGSPCLHALFFESYQPGITLGDMFQQAKRRYAENVCTEAFRDCLTLQEFILIGDPSLTIGGFHYSL